MSNFACLGYGILIENEFATKLINEEDYFDLEGEDFRIYNHGYVSHNQFIIYVNQSILCEFSDSSLRNPIEQNKFAIDTVWDKKLLKWAKNFGIKTPKIGWWICVPDDEK